MKTKNIYRKPIDKKYITGVKTDSPAHIDYYSKKLKAHFDLTHAIDFKCDEGSPIRASLDGEISDVRDNLKKNYDSIKMPTEEELPEHEQDGNFVVIKHENREFSIYSHLKYKGIIVEKGQKVRKNDIIAYSGNTGWSPIPHLHFTVFNFVVDENPYKGIKSLEVKWEK